MTVNKENLEMDVSESDYEAMRSTNKEEYERAWEAWADRSEDVLAEWQKRLMGKTFIDDHDKKCELDNPEVRRQSTFRDLHWRRVLSNNSVVFHTS